MRKSIYLVMGIFSLLFIVLQTYAQKQDVTVADYARWSSLNAETISPEGEWVSYNLSYDYGSDTLFIQNVKSAKQLVFPGYSNANFSGDDRWLTASSSEKGLILYDLQSGTKQYFKDAIGHEFCHKGNYISILNKNTKSNYLTVIQLSAAKIYNFEGVVEFSINSQGMLAISTGFEVNIINPKNAFSKKIVQQDTLAGFKKMYWSADGKSLAFVQEIGKQAGANKNFKIFYHDLVLGKNAALDSRQNQVLALENITTYGGNVPLRFSQDGKGLFFNYLSPAPVSQVEPYEIWDSSSPLEYTQNKMFGNPSLLPKLAFWIPEKNLVRKIGTIERPKTLLLANRKYALCYNLLKYEPQYEYYAPADMYLKDVETGEERLILQKQSTAVGVMGESPKGNFLHYFKKGNWWIYDIDKRVHRNLTEKLPVSIIDSVQNDASGPVPYSSPGWSADEQFFIAYDQYDIWLLDPNKKQFRKITNGRAFKIRYRIYSELYPLIKKHTTDEFLVRNFNLSKGLVLQAVKDDGSSGFYQWNTDGTLEKLVFSPTGNSRLKRAANTGQFIFIEQTASNAPKLMTVSKSQTPKMLYQSNQHASKFKWGTAELIAYKDKSGNDLKGILYKPAGYIQGKKYPMVVLIYEKQSQEIHTYHNPTEYGPMGFTPSNYFLNDYLVLMPDIAYKIGEPGRSALDCVLTAVDVVKGMGVVEENRIGIIGHSFGGYETAFIITQTNIFATAVCGSGYMNSISKYFQHFSSIPRSSAWRFESQQSRMRFSPFENWGAYERDAPLPNAANVRTPLLSWAGKKDSNISWIQSAEFHMALRRLGKKNVFIVYENESHTIATPELQKDLTVKTKNWFDFYLKNEKSAEWMTSGLKN